MCSITQQSLPLPLIGGFASVVSVIYSQPWPQNTKGKFSQIIHKFKIACCSEQHDEIACYSAPSHPGSESISPLSNICTLLTVPNHRLLSSHLGYHDDPLLQYRGVCVQVILILPNNSPKHKSSATDNLNMPK